MKKQIPIYMTVDPTEEFVDSWKRSMTSEMRKGWRTWIYPEYKKYVGRPDFIHPENNRYSVNFPGNWFAIGSPPDSFKKFFEL